MARIFKKTSVNTRIGEELDKQIRLLMNKNNIGYVDASRELAKLTENLKGRRLKLFKEVQF